jgi:hypothetical protein
VGVSTVIVTAVRAILDTGAGPNLVREDLLPEDWERYRLTDEPRFNVVGAGGKRLRQKGVISMFVELGRLRVKARFLVIAGLAAECILGCQFIDRYVQSILPKEKRILLSDNSAVYILQDSDPLATPAKKAKPPPAPPSTKIRVARSVMVPSQGESLVVVQCAAPGLRFLQSRSSMDSHGVYMANGIAEILPLQPFTIRVFNTSSRERRLPKGMVLGHALTHPKGIVAFLDDDIEPRCGRTETPTGDTPEGDKIPHLPDRPDVEGELWRDEVDLNHLLPHERSKVFDVLGCHRSMWDGRLGHVHSATHRIHLVPGAKPVHAQPYRAGPRARENEASEVQRMLKEGVIEPASSEWASPVVLVPKPDGSMRFCVDYRRLNALTIRDSYPLPRMDECIDSLGDAQLFSTLDCNSGYWQIPVEPSDRDKTTFTSHEGTFRYTRMPFGLTNAPATFQRVVNMTLAGLTWKTCLVYLDDIIIFSQTFAEHLHHLDEVLKRLYRAGLSLKLKKCHFVKDNISYLGHVIRPGKLAVAEKNTAALKDAQPPTTQTELRSFLGLCNVYRRFVPSFASIASPLNALLRKGESPKLESLTENQLNSFNTLRAKLLDPPVLALPRREGRYILDTDASQEQIGCCLYQEQPEGEQKPIGYWSRGLTSAERNYSTTEKECLAIVWAILQLRPYLEGQRFLVRTDHHSLRWVLNLSDAQGRLARWRLRLLEFDYEVQYSPGKHHHGADTMSRLKPSDPEVAMPSDPVDTEIPCFALTEERKHPNLLLVEDLCQLQTEDSTYRELTNDMTRDPSLDFDDHGVLGRTLPSGEFQVVLPQILHGETLTLIERIFGLAFRALL